MEEPPDGGPSIENRYMWMAIPSGSQHGFMDGLRQRGMGENGGMDVLVRQFRLNADAQRGNQLRGFRPHDVGAQEFSVFWRRTGFYETVRFSGGYSLANGLEGISTLYSTPASLRARSVLPTEATCG